MVDVNVALAGWEKQLSLYDDESDIARINAAAGTGGADIHSSTAALLQQALALGEQSEGAFVVTIAPLTLAWGILSDRPRVVPDDEIEELLRLVDDGALTVSDDHATLEHTGMGIDLGGIAKGAACGLAKEIYSAQGVESALLSIGGNVYAHGEKPDGSHFRIGFRDPRREAGAYIASFTMKDEVIAVSGGYERFVELGGKRYIHIMDPRTGRPAESDIVSVGVIDPDGATADFYSTTLYVLGKERTLAFMRDGGKCLMLDAEGTLYVSEALQDDLMLYEDAGDYRVEFVPVGG